MTDIRCLRRMRIHIPGLQDPNARELYHSLLHMIDGIVSVKSNPISERILVIYDDRKIAMWQITALTGRIGTSPASFLPASKYTLRRQQMYLTIPLALLAGLGVKRMIAGKPEFADSLIAYEMATTVAVFTGYPLLRTRVKQFSEKIGISDDLLLSSAALFVAVVRESLLVFIALFLLSYNAYRKRNNTLSAAAKAGEVVALIDSENREPRSVLHFADQTSKLGLLLALGSFVLTRDPLLFSTLLVAANPRPAVIGARYGLNHAEIMTHEDCRYIPMHTGMDLYDLLDAKEIIILHAQQDRDHPNVFPPLQEFAHTHNIRYVEVTHIRDFTEPVPSSRKRCADRSIEQLILVSEDVTYPPVHQRQNHLIFLRGDQAALLETLKLSTRVRNNISQNILRTGVFNVVLTIFAFARLHPGKLNLLADSFAIATLGLAEGTSLYRSAEQ